MKPAKSMMLIFGLLAAIFSGALARGSQDLVLPLSTTEAHYVSAGIDDTGPISVTAKTDGDRWLSLEIEAYGKKYPLSDKQLAELKGFPLGSLKLTYGDDAMLEGAKAQHYIYATVSTTTTKDKGVYTTSVTMAISKNKGLEVLVHGFSYTNSGTNN